MLSPTQLERYLGILGVAPAPPSLEHLERLVRAHLVAVPFENVSKLLLKRAGRCTVPAIDEWLDGIERHGFGGTCYTNNPNLHRLLVSCGYRADLCGADMSEPDVHLVVRVRIGGREVLADVGYAAPFFAPLPADLDRDVVVSFGDDRYVLKPRDEHGRSRLDQYRGGERIHGYVATATPRAFEHFRPVVADSYRETSTFMNAIVVVRFGRDRMVRLHNQTVVEAGPDSVSIRHLASRDEIPAVAESLFGLPASLVADALSGIGAWADVWR